MFWRVALDLKDEGGVKSCDVVAELAKSGARYIYVEASSKEEACEKARCWFGRFRELSNAAHRRYRAKRKGRGLCAQCHEKAEPGKSVCKTCAESTRKRCRGVAGRKRDGTFEDQRIRHTDPLSAIRDIKSNRLEIDRKSRERSGGISARTHQNILRRLDDMGPELFRAWLVQHIKELKSAYWSRHREQEAQAAE